MNNNHRIAKIHKLGNQKYFNSIAFWARIKTACHTPKMFVLYQLLVVYLNIFCTLKSEQDVQTGLSIRKTNHEWDLEDSNHVVTSSIYIIV